MNQQRNATRYRRNIRKQAISYTRGAPPLYVRGAVRPEDGKLCLKGEEVAQGRKEQKRDFEYAFEITSVDKQRGTARKLLEWNRGHWSVETKNHLIRDTVFGEDRCLSRVGCAPANNAACANIALAVIFHKRFASAAEATRHFVLNREAAFEALLSPG